MGNWTLEVFKMGMYMTFPVAMFHIFNQPGYFEEWVTKKKRELYPPDSLGHHDALKQAIREHREKQDEKMIKALEEIERKQKL
ncbi:protein PET100 homolog, mitochondrial [Glossina fuscipes]|uniref:Protein PET100 homolog, mitochondrial n=1 Tax=Glossina fuscipes TaxID=7396 RepID=A0A9C6DT73_9MUSC|nr:protein PET100 homolog, mitochondrial [Glossina fuscipes]XP_037887418.1 protein PET100 homolog, mitochondrial [Glossina fuscipes]XP_037887419.1 protein PET100 homolog, mitochondrial [Glossina fuscipes]